MQASSNGVGSWWKDHLTLMTKATRWRLGHLTLSSRHMALFTIHDPRFTTHDYTHYVRGYVFTMRVNKMPLFVRSNHTKVRIVIRDL